MAKKESRFILKDVPGGVFSNASILIDRETGVNYLFFQSAGGAGGLTPLLDREGKPIVTAIHDLED